METTKELGIAAVVPVFNPEKGLVDLCRSLCTTFGCVVVVDDGSTENQGKFLELPNDVEIVRHMVNKGKGMAIKSAIAYLIEKHPEVGVMVCCDGDGQHSPQDVEKVASHAAKTGHVTLGVRDFNEEEVPLRSRFGNVLTSFLVRMIFRFPIYDTQTGLRAIPARLFSAFESLPGERYEYEMRQFGLMKLLGEPFEQIPIKTIYIENNRASHFRPIVDSVRVYQGLLDGTFTKFGASSLFCFLVDNLIFTAVLFFLQSLGWARRYDILVALVSARTLSATTNYLVNRFLVFKTRCGAAVSYVRYWILVVTIGGLSYVSTAVVSACVDVMGWGVTCVKIAVETLLFVISYRSQKKWVFQVEHG